jgi:hypothetical protein
MPTTIQTSFRLPAETIDKLDTLARWLLESRTSVVVRAVNELYAREAVRRNVEPYPEVDRSRHLPLPAENGVEQAAD